MLPASSAIADDTPVKSKIVAVDLFKNGLAIVKREATLGKAGSYAIDDVPSPVHGTFYIDSTGTVDAMVKMRDVEVPASDVQPGSLQDDLAGKKVVVHFKGDKRAPVSGTMVKIKPPKPEEQVVVGRYLLLQTAKGRVYVDPGEVAAVESEDAGDKVIRRRPQLVLTLADTNKAETKVSIRYIAHGLSWAPSYRVDISDTKTLLLEQHAVIRNELTDLEGADSSARLSACLARSTQDVRSLLSPRTSFAGFLRMNWPAGSGGKPTSSVTPSSSQQAVSFKLPGTSPRTGFLWSATPEVGEGVEPSLPVDRQCEHFFADGDTLALTVAKGKAEYERIVEWLIPDTRNAYGQLEGRGDTADDVWDALRFKNPLSFPMTTAPAMVTANGQFNGQRTSYWVNSGEETVLRVEKSLSVRTRATENEQLAKDGGSTRDFIWIGGRQYRKTTVEGELAVSNHRKETISLVIRRRFSGELVSADGDPKRQLREEGVYSVNKRQELLWSLPLKGGEEKKLKYTYTVLVPH